jgi:hypothetical protein
LHLSLPSGINGEIMRLSRSAGSYSFQLGVSSGATSNLYISDNSNNKIIDFTSGGNVGIGNSNPNYSLKVGPVNTTETIAVQSAGGGAETIMQSVSGTDSRVGSSANTPLNLITNNVSRMTIDTSGRVTMPYQPSFMAYGSWNYQASTYIWQGFATVDHNIGSHWNNNIGRFTAPIAGRYMIYATAHHSAISTYHLWAFLKNGGLGGGNWVQSYDANSGSATTSKQQVFNLAAGDYLEVASNATYANGYTGGYVAVGVYLIG